MDEVFVIGDIIRTRENLIGSQIGQNLPDAPTDRTYARPREADENRDRARQNSGVKIKVSLIVC
jgi:hypothetical protein